MATLKKQIKKVMLINPPGKITLTEQGSRERKLAVPSLGLSYLAAVIEQKCEVQILDVLGEGYENERDFCGSILYGLSEEAIRNRIRSFNPDLVGVSCLFSNRGAEALNLCKIAREEAPTAHIVLGGQHPTGSPHLIRNPDIDYIIYGEAENALVELIDCINADGNLKNVSQIILEDHGNLFRSNTYKLPAVDKLPYPAWHYLDLQKYWDIGLADYEVSEGVKKFMVMIASRGCPHACYFCTAPVMTDRKYRQRSVEDVVSEIRHNRSTHGINEVHFWDDNFFINKKRTKELLRTLIREFPGMTFQVPSGSEINAIDEEIIDLMAGAGFKKLFMAVESPNEETQNDLIDKKVDLKRIGGLVEKLRSVGIISEGSFMIGFPTETKSQIDRTFERATEFGFDRISMCIVNPLPGTPLYDQCVDNNQLYPDFNPQNIRYSNENIKLDGVERGYISERRRQVWLDYMKNRIDIQKYEMQNIAKDVPPKKDEE